MAKFLNDTGLAYFYSKLTSIFATKTDLANLGSVFTIKGSVSQYSDLPSSGNTVGDVYYVEYDETISSVLYPGQVGYIWITINNTSKWEQLGQTINVSEFVMIDDLASTTGNRTDITMTQAAITNAIPTNVSDLTNDSGFLTLSTLPIYDGTVV